MSEAITRDAAAELRHELRTPVNHILGYAEMLREDTADGTPDAATIDGIIAVAREVLTRVNTALPPTGESTRERAEALMKELRTPQAALLGATTELLASPRNDQFTTDVERIAAAARRLTTVSPAGSRFTPPATAVNGSSPATRPATTKEQTKGRILIVDDVEENRAVLERRLAKEGYAVASVASGEEALQCIGRDEFDLVLLDVLMPGMDGFAVLERIKENTATRSIPVIMISALDDLPSVVRCIEHGAEDFLSKPFDPVLLRARIGASLEKKRWHDKEADYLRQVSRVIEAASAVEHGNYASGMLGAIPSRGDELGRLARVFDSMAAGVKEREDRLRLQLTQLQADVSAATSEFRTKDLGDLAEMDALIPGTMLGGRYRIDGVVGHGGMGVVYRARDLDLGEDVAVKTVRPELLADEGAAERLKSEIRLARRISHRNVVRTHDYGEADGMLFVTMEYVQGLTVRELLHTRGQLGVASTLALARQFAEALAVAHAAGVIHRDVKPENALVDSGGVLKVMDFGIARLAETGTTTMAGMMVGTPMYMAPEQLVGEEIDVRADLYSLGALIYECLTGQPPFQAPTLVGLIAKVMTGEPDSPAKLNADVPPALSGLVMELLSRDPARRPPSASSLLELLREHG